MEIEKKEDKIRSMDKVWFIAGSITLCTVAFIVIPKIMPNIAGYVNKQITKYKNNQIEEDDWGPVFVRRRP